jgi:hypothetical protein
MFRMLFHVVPGAEGAEIAGYAPEPSEGIRIARISRCYVIESFG